MRRRSGEEVYWRERAHGTGEGEGRSVEERMEEERMEEEEEEERIYRGVSVLLSMRAVVMPAIATQREYTHLLYSVHETCD